MIRSADLTEAIEEATRFLKRAKELNRKSHEYFKKHGIIENPDINGWGPKCAAVKRASMDLTKPLAKLRHPWRTK